MARDDGGPAFPRQSWDFYPSLNKTHAGAEHPGASLRDYFAIHALAGMLAYPGDDQRGSLHNNCTKAAAAEIAYEYADAMLAARQVAPSPTEGGPQ